jgi:hypothetical protein
MLTITREGNIITVVETIHGFVTTRRTTVRYDMDDWTSQIDNEAWQPMSEADRHWVVKHYLPKTESPSN